VLLVVGVFALTGRWSENPNALRRLQQPTNAKTADWFRLSVKTGGVSVPFVISVPLRKPQDGEALPEGLIVNGLEEIIIGARRTESGFEIPLGWLGASIQAKVNPDDSVQGAWRLNDKNQTTQSYELDGYKIPDALPERRYPVAPALPEAKPVPSPLPTRYKIQLGTKTGILRYRTSTTHAIDVTIYTPGESYGALAGSQYGRLLQASSFDGRRAMLLQATISPDGSTIDGFLSANGTIQTIKGWEQNERITVPFQRELTADELTRLTLPETRPAIVWHTSIFDAASQRMATGLARMLKEQPTAPRLVVYLHDPEEGYDARVSEWLTYHGLNAEVARINDDEKGAGPLPAIAFISATGTVKAAYTGLHGPGTGGSYRKQLSNWATHAADILK
jgi:hypothetical protein